MTEEGVHDDPRVNDAPLLVIRVRVEVVMDRSFRGSLLEIRNRLNPVKIKSRMTHRY